MSKVARIYSKPQEPRYTGVNWLSDFIRRLGVRPPVKGAARWAPTIRHLDEWD